jgi:glyoxylase-like metal-dependent hydrolase (beta-lactamase superfamily II)
MAKWIGGTFGDRAECVLAPNPSPMTLEGTNTWILREPGALRSVVIDPGPLDESHLARVLSRAGEVAMVLLTHGHLDHSEGAARFAELAHCGVRALDPSHRLGSEGLADGDAVEVDGLHVDVVGTPGHSSDSLSFVVPAESAVLTGDTVLGRGTTVVAHPEGELGAYLGSLRRLRDLASVAGLAAVLPGHGPVLDDALAVIEQYLAHRRERLDQVRDALASGAVTALDVVRVVYDDVDPQLWPAAELSVRAQLAYLRSERGG